MKMKSVILFAIVFLQAATMVHAQIMSGEDREKRLEAVKTMLEERVRLVESDLLGRAPSPFSPDLGLTPELEETKEARLSDEELLGVLANDINPTGIFMIGGKFSLMLRNARVSAGAIVDVIYKGTEYSVRISEITGSTYVISFGDASLQQKLK